MPNIFDAPAKQETKNIFDQPTAAPTRNIFDTAPTKPAQVVEPEEEKGILGYEVAQGYNVFHNIATAAGRHEQSALEAFEGLKEPGVWHKVTSGLETIVQAANWVFSPIEGAITTAAQPLEKATGVKGLAAATGDITTNIGQLFISPGALIKAGKYITKPGSMLKALQEAAAPATLTKDTMGAATILAQSRAQLARSEAQAEAAAQGLRRTVAKMDDPTRIEFLSAVEGVNPKRVRTSLANLSPELQKVAQWMRNLLDNDVRAIQSLGKGHLQNAWPGYVARYWKKNEKSVSVLDSEEFNNWARAKAPLGGKRSFLKRRTVNTIKEGIERFGLELETTDPIKLTLDKHFEMRKYYYDIIMTENLKKNGLVKFFNALSKAPRGMELLTGPIWRATRPAKFDITKWDDKTFNAGIREAANKLGITLKVGVPELKNPVTKGRVLGYEWDQYKGKPLKSFVTTDFMSPDFVLAHEFGHAIDRIYGVGNFLKLDSVAWDEMKMLASERVASQGGASLGLNHPYLHNPQELVANFIHGYLYAQEATKEIAPNAIRRFKDFLNVNDKLKEAMSGIKLGFEHEERTARYFNKAERVQQGGWFAPKEVAKVINNFTSKGLQGNELYKSFRKLGNSMTMAELSLSAYHAIFVTNEAFTSKLSLAISQAFNGHFGSAAKHIFELPIAPLTTLMRGQKLKNAYTAEQIADPALREVVNAVVMGGGRYKYDQNLYGATAMGSFVNSFKNGTFFRELKTLFKDHPFSAVFHIAGRALETAAAPIMDFMVPRMKMGAFYDAAQAWIKANPNVTGQAARLAFHKIWESIDNRFGQMVYDNLFWNKTSKDIAFLMIRSVGWNLGSIREIGGGMADMAKLGGKAVGKISGRLGLASKTMNSKEKMEFTLRASYPLAMTIMGAIQGAVLTRILTHENPKEPLDYFFPRTGRLLDDGAPERYNIPAYIKDVTEVNYHPIQTVTNKLNPLVNNLYQMLTNRDYYGAAIRNSEDPVMVQLKDWAAYMQSAYMPFSVRNLGRKSNRIGNMPMSEKVLGFLGIQPAPSYISDPQREQLFERLRDRSALRKLLRERSERGWPYQ